MAGNKFRKERKPMELPPFSEKNAGESFDRSIYDISIISDFYLLCQFASGIFLSKMGIYTRRIDCGGLAMLPICQKIFLHPPASAGAHGGV